MSVEITAVCPECGYEVDDATGVGEAEGSRPEPDNLAICIRCAGLGYYIEKADGTLGLRALTDDEKVELSDDVELNSIRASIIGLNVWMKQ